jgi:hypothetical protein
LIFRLAVAIEDQLQYFAVFGVGQADDLRMLAEIDP